jgi:proline racemase
MRLDHMITVVGAHAEGDVGRVITGGFNPPRAATMYERMKTMERDHDWLRQLMLSDPRGSVNCAVNLMMPPIRRDADLGMIVMEPDFYVPMSGGNLICTVTVALETGFIPMREPQTVVRVDTPAGLVEAVCDCSDGRCRRVTFRNVASFIMHRDEHVEVAGIGTLKADVAYGGMIYGIYDAEALGFTLARSEARDLVGVGERIKDAAAEQLPSVHPENPGIHTINQTLFAGPLRVENGVKRSKNTVVVSPGRLDRCPCGTGTSARLALLHAQGALATGETFVHESIIDTEFASRVVETTTAGPVAAVVPEISGRAWLTGISQYGVDPDDPFPQGYRLGDTWFG